MHVAAHLRVLISAGEGVSVLCVLLARLLSVASACGTQLLQQRLAAGRARGEGGVLLDGFPRTRSQADSLLRFSDVQLALNLHLREEVRAVLQLVVLAACRHLGKLSEVHLADPLQARGRT